MDEFEKALHDEVIEEYYSPSFEKGARWAFKWIDSRHLKAKWELMQERDKLRTENAKLREALEKIVIKPLQDGDNMLLVEEYNPSKIAKQALAETGGDDG